MGLLLPIAQALQALHTKLYVAHRDIKLENILMAEGMMDLFFSFLTPSASHTIPCTGQGCKLCDFGLAVQKSEQTWTVSNLTDGAGTVYYAAPEIFKCYEMGGTAMDAFSVFVCPFVASCPFVPGKTSVIYA